MQCIAFRLMLSSCVCVCVCVSMPRLWMPGTLLGIETSFFFKLREMTPDITCTSLTQKLDYKFQYGEQNGGRETPYLAVTKPFINMETSFLTLNCAQ